MKRYLLLLALAGCATTSSFNQSLYTAAQLNDAAVKAIGSLVQSGTLSSTTATKALTVTNSVQASLVLAQAAENAGNAGSAQATMNAVTATLTSLTTCLANKTAGAATACIAGVPSP